MQRISFKVDGQVLKGTLFYPKKIKEKNPATLFVQGWTSKKERSYQYAKALSKLGFICLLFDNKGHGESDGDIKTFTIREFLDGVLGAYDYLLGIEGADKENISAVGSSFGGYLIALLSEKRKLRNLVLRAPADYPNQNFNPPITASGSDNPALFAWRKQKKKPSETHALQALSNFQGDILIIESEKDDSVPHETVENYINAVRDKNKLSHVLLKGAPHSIKPGKFRDEITRILVKWFNTKL